MTTSNDSSFSSVIPRSLLIRTSKPSWRQRKLLIINLLGLLMALSFNVFLLWLYFDPSRSDPGILMGLGVINFLFIAAFFIDSVVFTHQPRRRRAELQSKDRKSADENIELDVHDLALRGCNAIPTQISLFDHETPPDAIYLAGWYERNLPNPTTCDIPFEPLPLGKDPQRTRQLLQHFVGLGPVDRDEQNRSALRIKWNKMLPPTKSWFVFACLAIVFFIWRFFVGGIGVWPFVLAIGVLILPVLISFYLHEGPWISCWLFPGVIAVRRHERFGAGHRDLISRRSYGILWYDAIDKRLFLPSADGTYHKVRCEPRDGLLAVWAWLNTAEPPAHIQLDDIA